MLPPFHIRNLWPSSLPRACQDTLVQINASSYDATILSHPAATLKYYDQDDGDLITLGSSRELTDKLEESVLLPSSGLPTHLQNYLQSPEHHVFEIDDSACVQKLWQVLQSSGKDSGGVTSPRGQGDALEWSSEQKNSLAIFYERCKAEVWSPIAKELGVTWESVDAMHWALGKEEMARRAHECNLHSEQSKSLERTIETEPNSTYNAAGTQHFEDYRVHHFNATRPPQVRLPMPLSPRPVKMAGPATSPKVSNLDLDRWALSIKEKNEEASLAKERKRQAQAVALNLRSRMTAVDSHEDQWLNHKQSIPASLLASTSSSLAFDGPGLTSEGKRQAQVAGDKLRWRTNPVRHSKPSRVGALEHTISKNRWSSYSGSRAARFDERRDASKVADNEEVSTDSQKSLLEVFEAELAKKMPATDREEALRSQPSDVQIPVHGSAIQVDFSSESQAQPSPQGSQAFLRLINEHLHELTPRNVALSPDISTVIGHGIRGLGACIQSITRGLQEVSSVSRQAADRTRNADLQLVDDAVLGFQSLAGDFIAGLGGQMARNRPGVISAPSDRPEEVEAGSSSTTLDISDDKNPREDALKSSQYFSNGGDDPSKLAYNTGLDRAIAPSYIFEDPASLQPEVEVQTRIAPAMSTESRFHKPGPIQLPNRPRYVDHLRQSQSVNLFDEQYNIQRASSPPLDTHFPTLAQFEGQSFTAVPTFPALPNMQPLVPQRAPCQYKYGTKAEELANGSLPLASFTNSTEGSSQSHDPVSGHHDHSALREGCEGKPLSRLSSAARLAEPFDPLEAEPSARVHLTAGLRRNATIASTDIRPTTRRRRPYSEVFDGSGRVPWGTFLQDNDRERKDVCSIGNDRGRPLGAAQKHPERLSRPEAESRCSPLAVAGYDDQHHDDSTVGKINYCVEQLRDLGFGGQDVDSAGRLLVYAQAADGVLVDAIDLIDEEQRAWQRL